MKIEKVQVKNLKFAEYNPRFHSEEFLKKLKRSISEFGYIEPIIWNKLTGNIVGGHARLKALNPSQDDFVDVVVVELDEAKEKLCNIALNKISGEFDEEKLQTIFEELKSLDFDLTLSGFDDVELLEFEPENNGLVNEDSIPEVQETTVSQTGKIYQLGKHRLMCGSCFLTSELSKLMKNERATFVFTDPPYDLNKTDYVENILNFSQNANVFIMHDDVGIIEYLRKSKLNFKRFFVADFVFSSPRGNDPYLRHILISHEQNGKAKKHNNMHDGLSSILKLEYRHRNKETEKVHKHQKPVSFVQKFIEHYSEEGFICLDLFGGSGSTLIACEKTNRICYMIELEPHYVDVIRKRWAEFVHGEGCNWQELTPEVE